MSEVSLDDRFLLCDKTGIRILLRLEGVQLYTARGETSWWKIVDKLGVNGGRGCVRVRRWMIARKLAVGEFWFNL